MKSNLKRNLLIGFSASLIILLISSTASYISIRNLLISSELVDHTNEVIIELNEMKVGMLDAETGQRGFLLTAENSFLEPYADARARVLSAHERLRTLTMDNPAQQASLKEFMGVIDDRFGYLDKSIEARKQGEPIITRNLLEGKEFMDKIRSLIRTMEQHEKRLLAQRTEAMDQFAGFTPPLIIAASLIALLITILFYVRVRADFEERMKLQEELQHKDIEISNRISIIQGIADKISQGNYSIRVDDKQSDALGNVAGSLNKMAGSLDYSFSLLSQKEWMQTGLAQLNDVMLGEKDVETLSRDVIGFLSSYTNSNVGAIYLLEGSELAVSAGYSYSPHESRRRIKAGDGILGQAVVTGKPIQLKDIPEGNITISFASGSAKPNHIIALPVYDGYDVKGAIELASLTSYSQKEVDFLQACVPNIGIAISTSQNRKRLQELLEETQSQSEELKTQHSELENMNSELETKAEKLQVSEEELKVQQEELKQANEELEERSQLLEERNQMITERNVEIQAKAEQLEQSTRYKSEFLANMSHELRTPLNSILLLSRLLSENQDKNLTTDQTEYARVIQSSGHGLLSLIDEILDLSKIESGKMQLEFQRVSLKEVIGNMTALFNPVAVDKHIEFKTQLGGDVPETIETDKLRLEQIIRNLLSNAIKFTTKGYVQLSVERAEGNELRITVKDTGIGIPKEKQLIVFDAFQQADGSTRRKYGGTGLGLSISRELVKLLGGEISLTSEPEKGSEFTITIPITPGVQKPMPSVSEPAVQREPDKYISTVIPENIPDDRKLIRPTDMVMLIIEDDVNFGKALLDYTRSRGYKGIVSVRGDEGVELAQQFLPAGILLDIQLPIKSGWEVMEELKSNPLTRHIPVHIMSSHEVKSESLMKGAVNFINKPVAFDQMKDVFNRIEYVLTHHPKKVLIVEENAKHAKALAYFLQTFDVSLEVTAHMEGAIKSLQGDVDCVILDMGIPDQKGYDMLETVKKTPGLENLPIIIFTGKSLSQTEELKIKQYADSIIVKTAHSYKRVLDEVSLFLHLVESNDKKEKPVKYNKLGALDEVLKNKTVLIADDDMRNVFSLSKALEKYKMNVIAAVDGKDALQKLRDNQQVDIVLMDMMMPEMDGYESTTAIRKDARFKDLPVIAVTAKAMMGDRIKCINAGASDYITKPVDIDQLLSLLRVWLYEKGQR